MSSLQKENIQCFWHYFQRNDKYNGSYYIISYYILNKRKGRLELHMEPLKTEKSGRSCKILFSLLRLLRGGGIFVQIRISGL